jgi:hypothetical protein
VENASAHAEDERTMAEHQFGEARLIARDKEAFEEVFSFTDRPTLQGAEIVEKPAQLAARHGRPSPLFAHPHL